jgi:type I restriction enzyme, S subunit
MKPYPHYKDSGAPWLGEIPAHWEVIRIKHVAELNKIALPENTDPNYEFLYIDIGSVTLGQINAPGKTIRFEDAPSRARRIVKNGDIIVSTVRTYLKAIAHVDLDYDHLIASTGFAVLSPKALDRRYFAYLMMSEKVVDTICSLSVGVSYPAVNATDIATIPIWYPTEITEQEQISRYLDEQTAVLDTLIAKKQQLIDLLREERTAVINAAVTGQFDTRSEGLDRYGRYKDSGIEWLGPIPEHWKVVPLKHLAYVQTGTAKGRDFGTDKTISLPYMRVANVQDGYIDLRDVATITIRESEVARYSLQKGDVLMNEGGDNDKLGRGAVWEGEIAPCVHQNHVFAVRPHDKALSKWIALIILTNYAKTYFMMSANQSTNLASISSTNLKLLPVLTPLHEETVAIFKYVRHKTEQIDQSIAKTEQQINLLQEYRTALISAAVTGQVDVRQEELQ